MRSRDFIILSSVLATGFSGFAFSGLANSCFNFSRDGFSGVSFFLTCFGSRDIAFSGGVGIGFGGGSTGTTFSGLGGGSGFGGSGGSGTGSGFGGGSSTGSGFTGSGGGSGFGSGFGGSGGSSFLGSTLAGSSFFVSGREAFLVREFADCLGPEADCCRSSPASKRLMVCTSVKSR